MIARNLLSVYQGDLALEESSFKVEKRHKILKDHESKNLKSFCSIMYDCGCSISDLDGFYVGYSIEQITKEFDLLRFGENFLVNIELKSELKSDEKEKKILKQMRQNYYYLKFLGRDLRIFTYIENDGFYEYITSKDAVVEIDAQVIATCLTDHPVDYTIDPSREFLPSNYLISPFNSTEKFLNGEYFLTSAQQQIKDEIKTKLEDTPFTYFSISANAGTGKTLLMYDIAKEMIHSGKDITIIHCGILNSGHSKLIENKWNIRPIRDFKLTTVKPILSNCSMLFIDEAQRINEYQLKAIIQTSIEEQIPIIFSYDVKQYLKNGETRDIEEYIKKNYSTIPLVHRRLTTKIRTNKEMASFITNLFRIGHSNDHLNYHCVTIEYMSNSREAKEYISFLQEHGWTSLTYTTSQYDAEDPFSPLQEMGEKNAHSVIGQEFPKVVFVMDSNFKYSDSNQLMARSGYYSPKGMLYQIVTRVVNELKIVVLDNPDLYFKLLEIKLKGGTI